MSKSTSYIINYNEKSETYTLISKKDEVTVDRKHKKYEWLKSQEAGRIVKISDKGRWNSSKDYNGLYDEINSSASKKKKSIVQTKIKHTKPINDNSSVVNELKTQLKELQTLNNQLNSENIKHKNEIELLNTKNTSLRNEIQLLKKKPQPVKTNSKQKTEKKVVWKSWRAKIMATESYTSTYPFHKLKHECNIQLITSNLNKKPTSSNIKAFLKQHTQNKIPKHPIKSVSGLSSTGLFLGTGYKLSNNSLEYRRVLINLF